MSAAYSRSSMKSKQPPPSARHARPRAPEPSEPHGSALQVRICSSSCLSWLHLLKSWSLRQSRGGSPSRTHGSRWGGQQSETWRHYAKLKEHAMRTSQKTPDTITTIGIDLG